MTSTDKNAPAGPASRQRAQDLVQAFTTSASACTNDMPPSAMRELILELRQRQVELDIQNDELHRNLVDLDTAKKVAEEQLCIVGAAFEVQDAIAVVNLQREILRVNQAFTKITGYTEQDVLKKTTKILRSREQPKAVYEDIWLEVIGEGGTRAGRWLQHKNGKDFFAQGTTTAVKDQHGDTTHYVITFFDQTVTQQQDELRLQHEVAHRESLVREVHHRIKNKLQGINGLLQQFASQKPEIAEQMRLVAGHLTGISTIHGLQGRLNKSRVRLCELISEIAQATSALWQTKIYVDIPNNWVFRVVSEKESVSMALVLNELMVNAIKHGGKAQGHIRVTLQQGRSAEGGVEVRICNAGVLRDNNNHSTDHHHGLKLIESLRPRKGLTVTLTQHGDQVQTLIQITAPVIAIDPDI